MPAARFDETLRALVDGAVDFVLIGGLAGIVHGAALKRAAGRAKDLEAIAELEILLARRAGPSAS